jgi:hypothetical protein
VLGRFEAIQTAAANHLTDLLLDVSVLLLPKTLLLHKVPTHLNRVLWFGLLL